MDNKQEELLNFFFSSQNIFFTSVVKQLFYQASLNLFHSDQRIIFLLQK